MRSKALLPLASMIVCISTWAQSTTAIYGEACRAQVGEVPSFSCKDGVVVPITVDGAAATRTAVCDHPGLLDNGHGEDDLSSR